jgi:pimeloyl-ACP methyl ester carboxylesterase
MHYPLQLKLIHFYFKLVSKLAPSLAVSSAHRLFHTPVNTNRENRHAVPLPQAETFDILLYENLKLQGYRWGKSSDPKVLLVHGWSTTSRSMSHFTDALLSQGYQVFSYDALSHGESQNSFSDLAGWADSVQAVMKYIGPVECIIAHSFGAAAVTVASKFGVDTKKLILISPIHDIHAVAENFAEHLHIPKKILKEMFLYTWEHNQIHFSKYGTDLYNILISDFHVPTLILHDGEDKEIDIEHARQISKMWPWAKLITTQGLGHRKILDDREVVENIMNFIITPATKYDFE